MIGVVMKFLNYGVSKKSRKLGIKPYSKRKIPPAYLQGDINQKKATLEVSGVFPRETKKYPSLNQDNFSPCVKKERNHYTGSNMLGVSTLHKSNPIPVFNTDDAVDHANMRRN
tara:strand:- start:1184 stop:1522 length:339 start_codon:yes stop_codon:yes gene_type:complete